VPLQRIGSHIGRITGLSHVIWINGAFSVGKTSVANRLTEQLEDSFLLDPEVIGGMLRDHLVPASLYPGDFQDLPLWRAFTHDAVLHAAEHSESIVVVPMTVARRDYFEELIGSIRERVRLDHYTLVASRETILRREANRSDDTGGWAAKAVDRVLPELEQSCYADHIDAETNSPQAIATDILARVRKS
jgi:chloramphenicol 3-O-phosphotransferase